jgi:23S rRNA pseudouridine1911/1915/1917 synthase
MAKKRRDPNSKIFHVSANHVGQTVASVIKTFEPDLSWTKIRKLVASRHVQVNGNLCLEETRRLQEGEVVKFFEHPLAPPPKAESIEIVYLDQFLVVVNKPSGITSVRHAGEDSPRGRKQKQPTLEDLMPEILARRAGHLVAPEKPRRPIKGRPVKSRPQPGVPRQPRIKVFPVHRLDRDTSGLLMFALSTSVEEQLVNLFSSHSIERAYRAVAHGNVRGMTIESELARDRGDGLRGSVPQKSKDTQHAITHVRPVQGLGNYTLVECRLETGRTHQIRIHLSEQGHMICGEKTYVKLLGGKTVFDRSGAPRLALHAFRLDFTHPVSGRKIGIEAPLPSDLKHFIERLQREKKAPKPKPQRPQP